MVQQLPAQMIQYVSISIAISEFGTKQEKKSEEMFRLAFIHLALT